MLANDSIKSLISHCSVTFVSQKRLKKASIDTWVVLHVFAMHADTLPYTEQAVSLSLPLSLSHNVSRVKAEN
jgi:hypothetical protein